MFNKELKNEALNKLEQEKKNLASQISITTNKLEALREKKIEAINNIDDFYYNVNLLKDKPKHIEEDIYRVNFILKNFEYQREDKHFELECIHFTFDNIGGINGMFTDMMSSKANKEIAERTAREIESLKSSIHQLKKIGSNIEVNYRELNYKLSTFLFIMRYKINFTGKSHWSELSENEMNYIGTAINLASTIAKMLNEKIV